MSSPKASESRGLLGTHTLALFSPRYSLWSGVEKVKQGGSVPCEWTPSF